MSQGLTQAVFRFGDAISLITGGTTPGTLYSAAYGSRDLAQTQPNTLDSLFWMGSLTKLHTAVAVMIAVARGLVTLDQNVREIVPELAELDVIEGFDDDGTPRLRKCTAPISLR
jgi:CubicO group peptidase (beta-lactamase class C family)